MTPRLRSVLMGAVASMAALAAIALAAHAVVRMGELRSSQQAQQTQAEDTDMQALLDRARRSVAEGDLDEAGEHYAALADLDPANPEAAAYAGWLAFLDGEADQALDRLETSLREAPFYVDAHLLRGLVLLRGFDDELGAAAEFETVLRLDPDGALARTARRLLDEVHQTPGTPPTGGPP